MKTIITLSAAIFTLAIAASNTEASDTRVKGYTKKDGTYVQPHYRSKSNGKFYDNYSTLGNSNPYTGKSGSRTHKSYGNSGINSKYRWGR